MSLRKDVLKNAYRKLDNMPLSFGLLAYSDDLADEFVEKTLGSDLNDALREIRMTDVSSIATMSYDELQIENRVVYHALRRFRLTASAYFKFSTATDGKSVDKSGVSKAISEVINEYDKEWRKWKIHASSFGIWGRSGVLNNDFKA